MKGDGRFHISVTVVLLLSNALLPAASVIQFSTNSYSVNESDPAAVLQVERSGDLELAVSVDYATANGTAIGQLDYVPGGGTLYFAPGETNKTLAIRLLDDRLAECSEMFRVNLSNPSADASLGVRAAATVTIRRNDWGLLFIGPPKLAGTATNSP